MDIRQIRYRNARTLVIEAGGISEFAERLDRIQSQVSSFAGKNPTKGIGPKIARLIEQTFGKPHGWLDKEHALTEDERRAHKVMEAYLESTPEMQEAARRVLGIHLDSGNL